MSRYFPHAPYAEDQPFAKTILTTHVLTRAVTTGSVIGAGIFGSKSLIRRIRNVPSPSPSPLPSLFLRAAGTSTLWTVGIVSLGLAGRMWGREQIEWQDRSWRLLENRGQLETDDWTYGGMAAGLVAGAAVMVRRIPVGVVGVVGSVGTGSVLGMLGYLGWRKGVHGGRFPGE